MEVVQRYTVDFHRTLAQLNTLPPSIEPTATGHIVEQIELIKALLDEGYAYEVKGSVYFDVIKFNQDHTYGKLSGRNIEELIHNTRTLDGQEDKKIHKTLPFGKKPSLNTSCVGPLLGVMVSGLAPRMYRHEHQIPRPTV